MQHSDIGQSQIIGGYADVCHSQIIGGNAVTLLGVYTPYSHGFGTPAPLAVRKPGQKFGDFLFF